MVSIFRCHLETKRGLKSLERHDVHDVQGTQQESHMSFDNDWLQGGAEGRWQPRAWLFLDS